jgi:hypothetical protein
MAVATGLMRMHAYAHVSIGGRKAGLGLHQPAALRCLMCHPEAQRHHHPNGPAAPPDQDGRGDWEGLAP